MISVQKISHRGTEINKISLNDNYDELSELNYFNELCLIADEKEIIYVSNGFLNALKKEKFEEGEWHHYFVKDKEGHFEAEKFNFSN